MSSIGVDVEKGTWLILENKVNLLILSTVGGINQVLHMAA